MVTHTTPPCLTAVHTNGRRRRKRDVGADGMHGAQRSIMPGLGQGWVRRSSEVPVEGAGRPDQAREGEEAVVSSFRNRPSTHHSGRSRSPHRSMCPCTCTPLRSRALGLEVRTESRTQARRHHQLLCLEVRRRQRAQNTAITSSTRISANSHKEDPSAAGSYPSATERHHHLPIKSARLRTTTKTDGHEQLQTGAPAAPAAGVAVEAGEGRRQSRRAGGEHHGSMAVGTIGRMSPDTTLTSTAANPS